ncbi:hypothetical protein JST97_29660 [bacterium]|nr:hypothetical protein [bacterium]
MSFAGLRRLGAQALGVWVGLLGLNALAAHLLHGKANEIQPFGAIFSSQTVTWRLEGNGISHWLPDGLRDNGNPPLDGRPTRVLILGDSATEALQVNDTETFVSLAERQLRRAGWPVVLLNAGRARRSLADYVQLAPALIDRFKPDFTVVVANQQDFTVDAWDLSKVHFAGPPGRLRIGLATLQPYVPSFLAVAGLNSLSGLVSYRQSQLQERCPPLLPIRSLPQPNLEAPLEEEVAAIDASYHHRLAFLLLTLHDPPGQVQPLSPETHRIVSACQSRGLEIKITRATSGAGKASRGFFNTAFNSGHLNRWGHQRVAPALSQLLLRVRPACAE